MNQLREAVISVVIDSLTETSRAKKNIMRNLMLKKMGEDPRTDIKTQHPRNVAVRSARKGLTPPGQKGGDVERDEKGNIKRGMYGWPLLTPMGKITRISRQNRGKPRVMQQALEKRAERHRKASALASHRRSKEPGYVPPPTEEELLARMWASPGHKDHTDPLRW